MDTSAPGGDIVVRFVLTRAELSRRGKRGAAVTHSRYDARELTAPARQAWLDRLADAADPNHALPDEARRRLAVEARRSFMREIAALSVEARRRARGEAAIDRS